MAEPDPPRLRPGGRVHVCGPGCLPLCRHRQAGAGGIGRPKANPSQPGRTAREAAYMARHDTCECQGCPYCLSPVKGTRDLYPGCFRKATDCDHIGGRGLGGHKRNTARLRAVCHDCHMHDPHGRGAS